MSVIKCRKRLKKHINGEVRVWLMGDFNSRADVRGEGYDLVTGSGFYDTYLLAKKKDSCITVDGSIDGWIEGEMDKTRIDYIFCSKKTEIQSSRVIFNNQNRIITGLRIICERLKENKDTLSPDSQGWA